MTPRNWSGWIALAILFGLLIPATIIQSFSGTDAKSTDPVVQAGNLEAIVSEETAENHQTSELQGVVRAMAPSHTKSEDAAAVYASAMIELQKPVTSADLALLAKSRIGARQTVAELYAIPPPAPARVRTLVATLPRNRYLYKLARAQALERIGDRSGRREVSPALDAAAMRPKLLALTVLFSVALLAGSVAIVGYLSALGTGVIKWRGHPVEPASLADADRLAVRAAQFFGIFLLVELSAASIGESVPGGKTAGGVLLAEVCASIAVICGTLLITRWPIGGRFEYEVPTAKSPIGQFLAELCGAVAALVGALIGTRRLIGGRTYHLADYGLTKAAIVPSILWGIGGLFAVVPLAAVGVLIGTLAEHVAPRPDHPLMHMLEDPHNVLFIAGALLLALVQAPFTEELLFRGTLMPALSGLFRGRRYAVPLAIGVSSLIFASIHPQGFTLWLPLASVGVVNGVLCYQTRSVLPGMVMHALFNAVAISCALFIR